MEETKLKLKEFLVKFYDPFRYDVLKMLLHMGGLKGVRQEKWEGMGENVEKKEGKEREREKVEGPPQEVLSNSL